MLYENQYICLTILFGKDIYIHIIIKETKRYNI